MCSPGFTTGKPYAMEKRNRQSFVTDQYVKVAHGKAEREWPFIACSDSPFTEVCTIPYAFGRKDKFLTCCRPNSSAIKVPVKAKVSFSQRDRLSTPKWTTSMRS
jgi:hypothetical protein